MYPFPFAVSVHLKCPCHFVVKFWLSGSFRVKTSLVTDTEERDCVDGSVASSATEADEATVPSRRYIP